VNASKLPNLFILGAPKCGTTAFCNYLRQHPDIFVPPKELHYFGSDLTFRNKPRPTADTFSRRYSDAADQMYRSDCAIWYLFSQTAAGEIAAACPEAKCIALLRKPSQMLYSLHSEFLYQGDEDIADFGAALAAEDDRLLGNRIPPSCDIPWALQYRMVARYAEQLSRYYAVFPKDQVHVVLYDDLVADTPGVYAAALRFLDVDDSFRAELNVVNPNKVVRSPGVREFLRNPPAPFRSLARSLVRNQRARSLIGSRLLEMNTVSAQRPPLDPDIGRMLDVSYADDVEQLSQLIGRDLSAWLPTKSSP
jgi:hypothetical protein